MKRDLCKDPFSFFGRKAGTDPVVVLAILLVAILQRFRKILSVKPSLAPHYLGSR